MEEEIKTLKDFEVEDNSTGAPGEYWSVENYVLTEDLRQEAIKWIKLLLKISKTKIKRMPMIKLNKKGIDVRFGEFEGEFYLQNNPSLGLTQELYTALILCEICNITEEDLK